MTMRRVLSNEEQKVVSNKRLDAGEEGNIRKTTGGTSLVIYDLCV